MSEEPPSESGRVIVRTEFSVSADLVLDKKTEEAQLFKDEQHSIQLRNLQPDDKGHVPGILAIVVGPADSLRSALTEHRAVLTDKLSLLSLITRAHIAVDKALYAIDWQPHARDRRMLVVHEQDSRYPPAPVLNETVLSFADRLAKGTIEPWLSKAATYFRYGILDHQTADQFVKFWHALEIIAENTSERNREPIFCHECKQDLHCASCTAAATRLPLPKDAIRQAMTRIGVPELNSTFSTLLTARNTLMHGGDVSGVERKCKYPMSQIVNSLGSIVQRAILSEVKLKGPYEMEIDVGSDLVNGRFSGIMEMSFVHEGEDEHPPENLIPRAKIELISTWKDDLKPNAE
jgi:hypothetical protein